MSFVSKNPRFRSMILTDLAAGSIANPPSGSHRLINREGTLSVKDSSGLETAIGAGGTVDRITQTAHGFVVGEMLYYTGSNYAKAKADAANTAEIVGMVSRVIDVNSFEITLEGKVTGLAGLVAGSVYFLSASTAGTITATEPNVLGQISLPLGVAISANAFYVKSSRGAVVGGTNARTQITLSNTTSAQTVYTIPSGVDAGELTGWVYLDATSDLKFYVRAPFAKNGLGTDWNISPSFMGDTPPIGFSMGVTSAGLLQITMNPLPSGFVTGYINYAINAPAVGASFPLTVESTSVAFTSIQAKDSSGINFKENGATTTGSIADDGSWVFGISQASNPGKHIIYGTQGTIANQNYVLEKRSNDISTNDVAIRYGLDRTNGQGFQDVAIAGVGGGGYRFAANTTDVGGHTSGGAWTLGPASNTPYTTFHTTYKALFSGTPSSSTDLNGTWRIGANTFNNAGNQPTRVSGLSGSQITFLNRSSDSVATISISANKIGDSATTTAAVIAEATPAGAWTFGSGTSVHLLQGGANSASGTGAPLNLLNTTGGVTWRVGPTNNNGFVVFNGSDTGVFITNGGTSWTGNSDIRMKKNVVDSEFGLQEVMSLRPVKFDYTMDSSEESARVGFIAQEVHAVLPHAAYKPKNEEEMMGVSPTEMIPVLVKAIQELKTQLDQAQSEIEALKNK